jgi:histo-blood group ABO system transferase
MKIAFVIVATNRYMQFVPPLLDSIHQHFLTKTDKDYFVFTNVMDYQLPHDAKKIEILSKGWPGDSYYRYHYFLSIREQLEKYDYIYYLDADMKVVDDIGEEVLTELLGVQHPGFVTNKQGTPEDRQVDSTAYVTRDKILQYCCGGFQGGSAKEYLKLCDIISGNIDEDDRKGILAIYHDESHVNRYFVDNPPTRILNAGYCAPESAWKVPFPYKVLALDVSVDTILDKGNR